MTINETQKYPEDKETYDDNYDRIFNKCSFCHGRGYFWEYDGENDHWYKVSCLVCGGSGNYVRKI